MKIKKKASFFLLAAALSVCAQSAYAEAILRRGNGSEPKTIDPQVSEGVPESNIMRDLFEGLTAEDGSANVIPGVAETWDISEDGKKYTFHLR
ncbi:MAG: peptide ABC transporter substrate-binding protein, partial [Cardiobacteriaceae bacterium]|nr:peptide ABC transporter substrate-binding protein [Cardiobacteriaceae bacterium]